MVLLERWLWYDKEKMEETMASYELVIEPYLFLLPDGQ